jgi:WD40 repeat protein
VFTCAFTPDGSRVLSGGWDGHLRLWETGSGTPVTGLQAGSKPLSACAISPSGKHWLVGSLEGQLSVWDAAAQARVRTFLAHTRPISAIVFADEHTLVTASWDATLVLWNLERERDGRTLTGHSDIVAGCRLTPDGQRLVSWSHDGSLRVWDVAPSGKCKALKGHNDRVTAAAVAPEGRWVASGGRDGSLALWDLAQGDRAASVKLAGEIRACLFLPHGETLVTVDVHGVVAMHALPDLTEVGALVTRLPVHCADLDAAGSWIALGGGDGRVHFVKVEGTEHEPLLVTPTQTTRRTATRFQRLLGRSTIHQAYACTCPACRQPFELAGAGAGPGLAAACPHCRRPLRLSTVLRVASRE